jgi:hypothetical protein
MIAVWKDYWIEYRYNAERLNYYIQVGGDVIYEGIAVKRPNEDVFRFEISDIVRGYLNSNITIDRDEFYSNENTVYHLPNYVATVNVINRDNGAIISSTQFFNSYAYNGDWEIENETELLMDIVPKKVVRNSPFFFSVYDTDYNTLTIEDENSREVVIVDYDTTGANVFQVGNTLPLGNYNIYYNGYKYPIEVVSECEYPYILYYQNGRGGWSTMPMRGNRQMEVDKINYYTYKRKGSITDFNNPQMVKYQTDITQTWRLYTDWMTDEDSSVMNHLLTSQNVFLYDDLITHKLHPVIITNKEAEYKTFENQKRKKYYYTIDVESANTIKKQ